MNPNLTYQLAEYSRSILDLNINQNDLAKFNWLNPIPKLLTNNQAQKAISNLPEEITRSLLSDEESIKYFQDDIRALKLYIQTFPFQELNQPTENQTKQNPIQAQEFNQFFKENYISNQAYKLNPDQFQEYEANLDSNPTLDWNQYVFQNLQNQNIQNQNQVQPDYSLKYFFTQLQPTQRIAFLRQNKSPTNQKDIPSPILDLNSLPELPTLNNSGETSTSQNFQTQSEVDFQSQPQPLSEDSINFNLQAEIQTSKNYPVDEFQDYNQQQIEEIKAPILNSVESKTMDAEASYLNENDLSQDQNSTINQEQTQNQFSSFENTPFTEIPTQEGATIQQTVVSRQKGRNYAKIIGYSTAGLLASGTSALALFNSLFG